MKTIDEAVAKNNDSALPSRISVEVESGTMSLYSLSTTHPKFRYQFINWCWRFSRISQYWYGREIFSGFTERRHSFGPQNAVQEPGFAGEYFVSSWIIAHLVVSWRIVSLVLTRKTGPVACVTRPIFRLVQKGSLTSFSKVIWTPFQVSLNSKGTISGKRYPSRRRRLPAPPSNSSSAVAWRSYSYSSWPSWYQAQRFHCSTEELYVIVRVEKSLSESPEIADVIDDPISHLYDGRIWLETDGSIIRTVVR